MIFVKLAISLWDVCSLPYKIVPFLASDIAQAFEETTGKFSYWAYSII